MHSGLVNCLAVGVGGFFGAVSRYGVNLLFARWAGSFPVATFVINVSGSAFLGWFLTVIPQMSGPRVPALKLAIATGFVGAYTTFSTYMFETNDLLEHGAKYQSLIYLFLSLAVGLIGVRLGIAIGRG